jgi:hypothetical protein
MPAIQTKWEALVDRAMQVCVDTFGDGQDDDGIALIEYTHLGGIAYKVDGIFEAESTEVDPDTGVKIMSNVPQISFRLSQLQEMPDIDDTVLIRGYLYRVVEPQFDGQGTVTLRLNTI